MSNYYQTLGVDPTASQDEIKRAYRNLAMKHHPDKGGDGELFKEISAAYDTISDPKRRAEYDMNQSIGTGGFKFTTSDFQDSFNDMHTIFGNSPFAEHFQNIFNKHIQKNRDINIQCRINLLDSLLGKELEANFTLPSGRSQSIVINVPAGIEHGAVIRYQGLGDDTHLNLPRGNLNVTIIVLPDEKYSRRQDDLYTVVDISPIDAMIGRKLKVNHINGQELELNIRPGVNSGTEFASSGQGFPNIHGDSTGRFVIIININVPAVTDQEIIKKLQAINDEINKSA